MPEREPAATGVPPSRRGGKARARPGVATGRGPIALAVLLLLGLGCTTATKTSSDCPAPGRARDVDVFHRAETERAARLAGEVDRLQTDLRQAEEALVMAESGLLGTHSRAEAVSRVAEARVQVERAAAAAPWRPEEVEQARSKLVEAAQQVEAGNFGAAFFFVYRARRIADTLEAEASVVYAEPETRFIRGGEVDLRAGPSTREPVLGKLRSGTPVFPEKRRASWILVRTPTGSAGWVHATLVGAE